MKNEVTSTDGIFSSMFLKVRSALMKEKLYIFNYCYYTFMPSFAMYLSCYTFEFHYGDLNDLNNLEIIFRYHHRRVSFSSSCRKNYLEDSRTQGPNQ
jgi:hypothetical protein